MKPNQIRWNTNRTYTEHGQRIAAVEIDRGVFFVDVDRHICGFLPECPLDQTVVMHRYDSNAPTQYCPPSVGLDFVAFRQSLEDFAQSL